jgi:hypothetical protein
MEKEKKYLEELILIEEEISMNKIKALELLESNTAKETKISEEIAEKQRAMLEENERYLKEKLEMNLFLTKQRELSEKIELDTNEKLRQLRMQRSREDVSPHLYQTVPTCVLLYDMLLRISLSFSSFSYLCFKPFHFCCLSCAFIITNIHSLHLILPHLIFIPSTLLSLSLLVGTQCR